MGASAAPGWWDKIKEGASFVKEAVQGTGSMLEAKYDMHESNTVGSDKYFHAKGNYEAAQHGPGGAWAAEIISDSREWVDEKLWGDTQEMIDADQEANHWGRNGGDPNAYRPPGLPERYGR